MYILSGENMSLSFQANSVAGQANDYPIMVINRLSFFSSSEKSREKRKRKRERKREHCVDLKKEKIVHTLRRSVSTRKIVARTNDNLFPNSDGRKLSSIPSLIFFIDQSHLSHFPRGGIASFVDKLASCERVVAVCARECQRESTREDIKRHRCAIQRLISDHAQNGAPR